MRSLRLFAVLLAMGLSWGATIPLIKVAVSTGHHPFGLMVWQLLIAMTVSGSVILLKRVRLVINRQAIIFYMWVAILGTLIPSNFYYYTAAHLPAGVMAIIIASVPMFAISVALILRLEQFSAVRIGGVILGIIAIILLIAPDTSLPEPSKVIFVFLALISPLSYGLEANYIETKALQKHDPISTIFGASSVGFIIMVPIAFITDSWVDVPVTWSAPEIAFICSALISVVVYSGYVWMVSVSGAVFASQVAYIITVSGVFYSMVFLLETYSGWIWAALCLMICGLVLVQPRNMQTLEQE